MSARVDVDEIAVTRTEKLLAWILAGFLLVGAVWVYVRLDYHLAYAPTTRVSGTDQVLIQRQNEALRRVEQARAVDANALQDLTVAREAYRTALESHQPTRQLKVAYGRTQASYRDAERELQAARSDEASTAGPARAAEQRIEHAVASAGKTQEARRRRHDRIVFGLRLLFALLALAGSYAWLGRMRKRRSRYLVVGFALVGASAVLALIMAVDYITDYIDVTATGPVVLSLAGIALTLVALWSLQRYLAQRVPIRRVRKRECPFCGYPVGENSHCEGCGREVIARCSTCESPRRVGTAHCGACGAA